jgi:uncharacterized membrane protein (DUF106 family)
MGISMIIAFQWENLTFITTPVHKVLDPSAGRLLEWNINYGILIIIVIITLIMSLLQRFTVDQETLRQLKKEQKLLQEEMKQYKDHPEKLMALQKKQLEFIPQTFDLTLRPLLYTGIPFILFFRWFSDFFTMMGDIKIFGYFSNWIWPYLILSIILSQIWRKLLKLP